MSKGDHGFKKSARGSINGGYVRPRVQIGFERATLESIRDRAKKNKQSFAAEVRALIKYALCQGGPFANTPDTPR